MVLDKISAKILLWIASVFVTPIVSDSNWELVKNWQQFDSGYEFVAISKKIVSHCKNNPQYFIKFPVVILGSHEIYLDNRKILTFGDPTFQSSRSLYGIPIIKCSEIQNGNILKWRVYSYSKYFSMLRETPAICQKYPIDNFFSESMNMIAAGTLGFVGLFILAMFWGKVPHQLTITITLSCLFLSIYFGSTVVGLLGFSGTLLYYHKLANIFLWLGFLFYSNALRLHGYLTSTRFYIFSFNIIIALIWIISCNSGDGVQFGTTLPFTFGMGIIASGILKILYELIKKDYSKKKIFELSSFLLFGGACLNDILVIVIRTSSNYTLLSMALVGGIIFFVLGVNENINQTYKERDYLRENLEVEVKKKTAELEGAQLKLLESTQKELQHAKELSTIALNVAHDIRSPIAALSILGPTLKASSSAETLILRTAVDRIHHIADTLLAQLVNSTC